MESNHCPCCEGRRREWYKNSGVKVKLIIRRLQCEQYHKIHHILPNVLVPYKR
ncbi:DUF6431 domain-containing protein [Oceanobacillus sp. AG]|uniref:DUF6431 domain-containing protein n=1 Tax=Oceanobacillus sp. AG TaxID=2681969 RepID=UPI00351AA35C